MTNSYRVKAQETFRNALYSINPCHLDNLSLNLLKNWCLNFPLKNYFVVEEISQKFSLVIRTTGERVLKY